MDILEQNILQFIMDVYTELLNKICSKNSFFVLDQTPSIIERKLL